MIMISVWNTVIMEHDNYQELFPIRKYGKEAYKKVYSKSEPLEKYIYNGFEDDAIDSFLMK